MKKLIILTLWLFLAFSQLVSASEVEWNISNWISDWIQFSLPCNPASVSNGSVNAQTCAITCNAWYTLSWNSCIVTSSSWWGWGGGGGGWYTTTSTVTTTVTTLTWSLSLSGTMVSSGTTTTANITSNTWAVILQETQNSNISLNINPSTSVTWNENWDGKIMAPKIIKETDSLIVVEVWSKDSPLNFSKSISIEIKTSLPENSSVTVLFSNDWKTWNSQWTYVVKNGKITIITSHLSYYAIKATSSTWSIVNTTTVSTWSWSKITFPDINDSFAKDDIIALVSKWVIKWYSDGTFRPNGNASRAEFLAILMKAGNTELDETLTTTSFTDIPSDWAWMIKYIEKAKELWVAKWQIIKGKLMFRPNDPISRAEAITMLLNIAKIKVDATITKSEFTDVNVSWMIPYVAKAKELWIISGQTVNNKLIFRPNDWITRAEAVRIISNYLRF
jgi:hypothetical protein